MHTDACPSLNAVASTGAPVLNYGEESTTESQDRTTQLSMRRTRDIPDTLSKRHLRSYSRKHGSNAVALDMELKDTVMEMGASAYPLIMTFGKYRLKA